MGNKRWVLRLAALMSLAVGACEKQVREAKAPDPAPAPVAEVPSSPPGDATPAAAREKPSETQPVLAMLSIDGISAEFPATKLLLYPADGKREIRAELFSDLPKSALRKYDGNELYLEMNLEGASDGGKVEGMSWRFKSTRSGKVDSPNGIFLNGQTTHLQPFDVMVKLDRRDNQLFAQIMGQFRAYEGGTPEAAAPFVGVRGELPVEIVQKP